MTFDFQRALGFALSARNFRPSPLPVGGIFPPTWYAPGWSTGFLNPANDIDTSHSYGYVIEPGWESSPGAGDGRSFVSPARTQGANIFGTSFAGGLPDGWTNVNVLTGQQTIINLTDPDPAVSGPALDLHSGATVGGIGGVQRVLPNVPNTFGVMAMPQLYQVGTNPADALWVMIQTNIGRTLMLRFYDNQTDVNLGGGWVGLYTGRGGNYIWEVWVMCVDNGDGTNTINLYSGTELVGTQTGVMPTGIAFANNSLTIMQRGAANTMRRSHIAQINVGTTQLADTMEAVCLPFSATFSPEIGHVMLMVEDVSNDVVINDNVEVFVTKDNVANWQKVTLAEVVPGWGRGEIGNLKPIRMFVGSVEFTPGSGQTMRWNYKTSQGTFAAAQGLGFFWDELAP